MINQFTGKHTVFFLQAAYDKGQDGTKYTEAFETVGISFEGCEAESHIVTLVENREYTNITASICTSPSFYFNVLQIIVEKVVINATSREGDVRILVHSGDWSRANPEVSRSE